MNCEAYFSFEGGSSNQRIVSAKIHQNNWSSLTSSNIRNQYMVTVRNKFDTFQETYETLILNDEYENFVTAHIEAAVNYIPTNQEQNVDFHGNQ